MFQIFGGIESGCLFAVSLHRVSVHSGTVFLVGSRTRTEDTGQCPGMNGHPMQ